MFKFTLLSFNAPQSNANHKGLLSLMLLALIFLLAKNLTTLENSDFKEFHMGSTERRQRHKSQLKRTILDEALKIIEAEGYQALTIRKLAEAIEYSLPTIYEFFQNKEELIKELQREWVRKFLDIIQEVHATEKEADKALEAISMAYGRYALDHGKHYRAVMDSEHIDGSFAEINTLRSILKDWIQAACEASNDLDDKVDLLRGYLHGIVLLALTNRLYGGKERCLDLMNKGVKALIKSWRK